MPSFSGKLGITLSDSQVSTHMCWGEEWLLVLLPLLPLLVAGLLPLCDLLPANMLPGLLTCRHSSGTGMTVVTKHIMVHQGGLLRVEHSDKRIAP